MGEATFSELVADCEETLDVVARFLALLELYRETVLAFEQVDPLGELHVRWVGGTLEQAEAAAQRGMDGVNEDEEYG
jgi:segregation and condensation protein A